MSPSFRIKKHKLLRQYLFLLFLSRAFQNNTMAEKVHVLQPAEFFETTQEAMDLMDDDEKWNLFVTKAWPFVTDIVNNGLGSKSNKNVNPSVYTAVNSFVSGHTLPLAKFGELMDEYVLASVTPKLHSITGVNLLEEFRLRWRNHIFMSCWMQRFTSGLEQSGQELTSREKPYSGSLVLRSFFDHAYEPTKAKIVDALLAEVTKYRDEDVSDPDMVLVADVSLVLQHMGAVSTRHDIRKIIDNNNTEWKNGLWMRAPGLVKQTYQGHTSTYATTVVYVDDFQKRLIQHTRSYYKLKSAGWAASGTVRYVCSIVLLY